MRRVFPFVALALLALGSRAEAASFTFDSDPFLGSNAADPGRQIIGLEASINFNIATDTFRLGQFVFGVGDDVQFLNDVAANIPANGVNTIVLRTLDNDNNPVTPFGACLLYTSPSPRDS